MFSVLFLTALILTASAEQVQIRIGVILNQRTGTDVVLAAGRILPAVEIALETIDDLVQTGRYANFTIQPLYSTTGCSRTVVWSIAAAADLYAKENVSAFLGPPCWGMSGVGNMAAAWNIPIFSPSSIVTELTDKERFRTLTSTVHQLKTAVGFLTALFLRFGWKSCVLLSNPKPFSNICDAVEVGLRQGGVTRIRRFSFNDFNDVDSVLMEASFHSRIIIICADGGKVRQAMVSAYNLGQVSGDYVFFSYQPFNNTKTFGADSWNQGDEHDEKLKVAYRALMTMRLFQPDTAEFVAFQSEMKNRMFRYYNFVPEPGDEINFFATTFHDALILYSLAVNETLQEGGNIRDGMAMRDKMWNRTYQGISGTIRITPTGDRIAMHSLWDMTDTENGIFEVIADYAEEGVEFYKPIKWHGTNGAVPPDTPFCGFYNENPACNPEANRTVLIAVSIFTVCVVVIFSVVVIFVYRKMKLNAELMTMSWKIPTEDLIFEDAPARSVSTMSILSAGQPLCRGSVGQATERVDSDRVARYKGRLVAVQRTSAKIDLLTRNVLLEFRNLRLLEHINVVRFVGAHTDDRGQLYVVSEYCPKGSIQHTLKNDSLQLDWDFKASLLLDIIKGLAFLHGSKIEVHGRLRSSNCLVDSRFVVKLADYGLHALRDCRPEEDADEHNDTEKLLWKAPEQLRDPDVGLTKEGDIYAVGIIMQEVAVRGLPFDHERNNNMDIRDIVDKVRAHLPLAFRPYVGPDACSAELRALMAKCWHETPGERPSADKLLTAIKKTCKGVKRGLMDNLLSRMELYANHLELLVEERTAAFLEEKKRSETLLYEVLPKSVAEQLKAGSPVHPEAYDSVTIYFSDIVGFTELSSQSTPMQVVDLLNDLYTCFDKTIHNFDVYKVETIGDAYMVVSGLPIRNRDQHAREIARMALALLRAIGSFKVKHKPHWQLRLRAGVHSGACVAGVVGLKMPRYCLFGDTVNTASRMESTGKALSVHISSSTERILRGFQEFVIEPRGAIEVKGKGTQETFWLLGLKE